MNQATTPTHVNTRMHRASLTHLEADDFSEGYQAHPETRQPVSCPPRGRNVPSFWLIPALGLLSLLAVASIAAWALWWPA